MSKDRSVSMTIRAGRVGGICHVEVRQESNSRSLKGILQTHLTCLGQFSKVWIWSEWPASRPGWVFRRVHQHVRG